MHTFSLFSVFSQKFLSAAGDAAQDKPVVVSKFILNAKEIEFDGVAQDGKILNYAISEHVEVRRSNINMLMFRLFVLRLFVRSVVHFLFLPHVESTFFFFF